MKHTLDDIKYTPGMYSKKRPGVAQEVDQHIKQWEQKRLASVSKKDRGVMTFNCVCFSREIGVGALEIADILSEKIGLKVVDREILEHIINRNDLKETTNAFFDERHPGKIKDILSMFVGDKSFIMKDYIRHLAAVVYAIAEEAPTIFVGRATHLILPRDQVLAVRFFSSIHHRIKRMTQILDISETDAKKMLDREDKQQRDFFKKNFGKSDASPYEFDMVINCDYCPNPSSAAEIVAKAYQLKFGWE